MNEKTGIESTDEAWDARRLGADERYVEVAPVQAHAMSHPGAVSDGQWVPGIRIAQWEAAERANAGYADMATKANAERDSLRAEVERLRAEEVSLLHRLEAAIDEIERLRKGRDDGNIGANGISGASDGDVGASRIYGCLAVAALSQSLEHRLGRGNGALDDIG